MKHVPGQRYNLYVEANWTDTVAAIKLVRTILTFPGQEVFSFQEARRFVIADRRTDGYIKLAENAEPARVREVLKRALATKAITNYEVEVAE